MLEFSFVSKLSTTIVSKIISSHVSKMLINAFKKYITNKKRYKLFRDFANGNQKLISEMKNDILNDNTGIIVFGITETQNMKPPGPAMFLYHESDHENIYNQITLLKEYEFVKDITDNNYPKYKFSLDFIDFLKQYSIQQ